MTKYNKVDIELCKVTDRKHTQNFWWFLTVH